MDYLYAAILGLVEGLTEYVPVSSTGHLILASHWLGFERAVGVEAADCFLIFIQLGAVLAVVLAYPRRFVALTHWRQNQGFSGLRGLGLLALTTVPAALVGLALRKPIKAWLFNPTGVAMALAAGGLWILAVEWYRPKPRKEGLDALGWGQALAVGLYQCLSLWPGMSRSAATILGGMLSGMDRRTATEYSFFAAAAVLPAAGLFDLYKSLPYLNAGHIPLFATGTLVAFLSGWMAVKLLVRFVGQHTLAGFAWYRLILAAVVFRFW